MPAAVYHVKNTHKIFNGQAICEAQRIHFKMLSYHFSYAFSSFFMHFLRKTSRFIAGFTQKAKHRTPVRETFRLGRTFLNKTSRC